MFMLQYYNNFVSGMCIYYYYMCKYWLFHLFAYLCIFVNHKQIIR